MIYVDPPIWPARGRLWSHLISDVSLDELHAFAERLGAPRRGFDRDHYDLPEERFALAVRLGARVVSSREIVRLLRAAGLRRPKHLYGGQRSSGARPPSLSSSLSSSPADVASLASSPLASSPFSSEASSRLRLARADASHWAARDGTR